MHPDHHSPWEADAGPAEIARIAVAADRGPRYEDAVRALRAALGGPEPSYAGTHYRFDGIVVDPCAVQARVPIWVGGRSGRSLGRALRFADGWDPFRLTLDELVVLLR